MPFLRRIFFQGECLFYLLVGDLNALCTRDADCQRYMICSGMKDGTRQCQCQTQFQYDNERRRCRKSGTRSQRFSIRLFFFQVVIMKHLVRVVSIVNQIWSVIKLFSHHSVHVMLIINIILPYGNAEVIQVLYVIVQLPNAWIMPNVEMEHVNVPINLSPTKIKFAVGRRKTIFSFDLSCHILF